MNKVLKIFISLFFLTVAMVVSAQIYTTGDKTLNSYGGGAQSVSSVSSTYGAGAVSPAVPAGVSVPSSGYAVPNNSFSNVTIAATGSRYTPIITSVGALSPTESKSRHRRVTMDEEDPFGGETIGGTTNPREPGTPLADGLWLLLIAAIVYAAVKGKTAARR